MTRLALLLALLPAVAGAQGFVPSRNVIPGTTLVPGATSCAVYADASGIARCSSSEAGYDDSTDIWIVSNLRLRDSSGSNTLTIAGGNHGADRTMTVTVNVSNIDIDFGAQGIQLTAGAGTGLAYRRSTVTQINYDASSRLAIHSGATFLWSSTTDAASGSYDIGFGREAAGVVKVNNGSSGAGWIQNAAGDKRVPTTVTNATTTMSNLTDLSVTVVAGRKYSFELTIFGGNTVAADGIKWDFDGGTATMTTFRVHCLAHDTALVQSAQTTALATDHTIATFAGGQISCKGGFVVNGAGTWIPRYAENATTTGIAAVLSESWLWMKDMP